MGIKIALPNLYRRLAGGVAGDAPINTEPFVYVLDDDPGAREAMTALIRSLGLTVESFPSAEAFLESYEPSSQPVCLVTDLKMDGVSGLDLHKHLVAREILIPTIIVTAFTPTRRCSNEPQSWTSSRCWKNRVATTNCVTSFDAPWICTTEPVADGFPCSLARAAWSG